MSEGSESAKTVPSEGESSERRGEKRRHDAGHDEELRENAPRALQEPAVCEGQEAHQEATSKEEDEHPRDGGDNPHGAVTEIQDNIKRMLAGLQEYRRELDRRIPRMREAFLAEMGEVFDQSLEEAGARWDAVRAEIGDIISEIRGVTQRVGELRRELDALKGTPTDSRKFRDEQRHAGP